MNTTLYCTEGGSDKFYSISINKNPDDTYSVPANWGRRGTSGQFGYKAQNVSLTEATKIYNKVIKEKLAKGYIIGSGSTIPPESKTTTTTKEIQILPQLLNETNNPDELINNPLFCAQEKFDGKRRILIYNNNQTTGLNKKGQQVDFPESIKQACKYHAQQTEATQFTIDGEEVGNMFHAFDIISLNNEDITDIPYQTRYQMLNKLIKPSEHTITVVKTASSNKEKKDMFKQLKDNNKEGIVFKQIHSHYKSGYSDLNLKFKFTDTASVIITKHNTKNSVAIAAYNESGILTSIGNVTMIGHTKPPVGSIHEVRYLYYFPGGSLFQPTYIGPRDDQEQKDCTITKLKVSPSRP